MEKFSQYRDRGTGIAPFLPLNTPLTVVSTFTHAALFAFRLPFFIFYLVSYLLFFHWLPLPAVVRKIALWGLMAIPGIWWVDLQLDGVKRGTLAEQPRERFPHPGSVIAANFTSPIDAVYLAAIFDPIFTISYPGTRGVKKVDLVGAVWNALAPVKTGPPKDAQLTTVKKLLEQFPGRVICIFPETGTTNGKAILPFSQSILDTPADVHIFPVSLRYSPYDVTTPVPGQWIRFLWNLLSRPFTSIRVRVAEGQMNTSAATTNGISVESAGELRSRVTDGNITNEEQRVVDRLGENLARLSRVKRVGLTMNDKAKFVEAYRKRA